MITDIGPIGVLMNSRFQDLYKGLNRAETRMEAFAAKVNALGAGMSRVGAAMSMWLTLPIAGAFAGAAKSVGDYEQGLVELQKVSSPEIGRAVARGIEDMSTELPLARRELMDLAAQSARFGVTGVENIKLFARTSAEMAAATDMSSEEAGKALAKLGAMTQTPVEEVHNLGSAINSLANNMKTSEQEIVEAGQRAGATLSAMGASQQEIVALSAGMNEVFHSARRAGTGMRRLSQEMTDPKKAAKMADAIGMDVEAFRRMRDESPVETIMMLSETMKEGGEGAKNLRGILGSVTRKTLVQLSQNLGRTRDAMARANESYEKNNSITKEMERQKQTLYGQLQLTWNAVVKLARAFAQPLNENMKSTLKSVREWIDEVANTLRANKELAMRIIKVAAAVAAIGPTLWIWGKMTRLIGMATVAASGLLKALHYIPGALRKVRTAFIALKASMPIILAIGTALASMVFLISQVIGEGDTMQQRWNSAMDKVSKAVGWVVEKVNDFLKLANAWWNKWGPVIKDTITLVSVKLVYAFKRVASMGKMALEDIGVGLSFLYDRFETFGKWLGDTFAKIFDDLGGYLKQSVSNWVTYIQDLAAAAGKASVTGEFEAPDFWENMREGMDKFDFRKLDFKPKEWFRDQLHGVEGMKDRLDDLRKEEERTVEGLFEGLTGEGKPDLGKVHALTKAEIQAAKYTGEIKDNMEDTAAATADAARSMSRLAPAVGWSTQEAARIRAEARMGEKFGGRGAAKPAAPDKESNDYNQKAQLREQKEQTKNLKQMRSAAEKQLEQNKSMLQSIPKVAKFGV